MTNKTTNVLEEGLLRYLKPEELKLIQSMRVGVGGAGGLGSNVAMVLVRTGYKHIEMLDHDVIDPSNLNRQQYFSEEVGQVKVEVTRKRLLDINPELDIRIHRKKWIPQEGGLYFKDCDFIIEAFDAAQWKFRFAEYYQDKTKYLISGVGMAGLAQKSPMQKRKLGNMYFVGDITTDTACGHPPMAPRVVACAAMMAEVVLDLTLGLNPLH